MSKETLGRLDKLSRFRARWGCNESGGMVEVLPSGREGTLFVTARTHPIQGRIL